ncbi:MAG: hypothetical protein KDE15_07855 [Erythrobacter sp.]|nr:hypothetical protein [Erythrobacter sp.]
MSNYPTVPGHRNVNALIAAATYHVLQLGRPKRLALLAICKAGWLGLTAGELASRLGMDRYTIQPRTSELRMKRLIRDSGQHRANATGKKAIVWVAV